MSNSTSRAHASDVEPALVVSTDGMKSTQKNKKLLELAQGSEHDSTDLLVSHRF